MEATIKNSPESATEVLLKLKLVSFFEDREPDNISNPLSDLNSEKSKIFKRRLENLLKSVASHEYLCYRGTRMELLAEKLCKEKYYPNDKFKNHFYANLFYFGEKAACYFETNKSETLKKSAETLFDALHDQLSKRRQAKRPEVKKFCESEVDFCNFFSQKDNKEFFLKKLNDNEEIILYYQYISHSLGKIKKKQSKNVSTTQSMNEAKKFAIGPGNKDSTPIVLLYAIPHHFEKSKYKMKTFKNFDHYCESIKKEISKKKLPFCQKYCYEEQKEVIIFGALIPHFIWGVYEINEKRIVVNPAFFNSESQKDENKCLSLKINQQNFDDLLRKRTNYRGYVIYSPHRGMIEFFEA